jgi:hypothetical protein
MSLDSVSSQRTATRLAQLGETLSKAARTLERVQGSALRSEPDARGDALISP